MSTEIPVPPQELIDRVSPIRADDLAARYREVGRSLRSSIEAVLPPDWAWEGKRVLDFGCGSGRVLCQFLDEARQAEFYGCDIDAPSIAWLGEQCSPPLQVFVSGEEPRLPQADGFFDFVYALSVFTHLTDHWAGWLLELRRVLKPDGLVFATFLNEAHSAEVSRAPWDSDRVGMNVLKKWNPWDAGGPMVLLSEWWVREHWGRAFEIVELATKGFGHPPGSDAGQGFALLQPRASIPSIEELERPAAGEPRELAAAFHNIHELHLEAAELARIVDGLTAEAKWLRVQLDDAEAKRAELEETKAELVAREAELARLGASRSWRITAPFRSLAGLLRGRSA